MLLAFYSNNLKLPTPFKWQPHMHKFIPQFKLHNITCKGHWGISPNSWWAHVQAWKKWGMTTKFERPFCYKNLKAMKVSKLPITKLQNGPQFWGLFSLWWFTQFGLLLSPIALKVVSPLLLDSNSSRDATNPPFQFPIWQLTSKETKRQAITKDQKNEMKAKPIEF